MSEQIREQVSAFLDGELPDTETELLLKRLTRDAELRESFGRYALIGESLRGGGHSAVTRAFATRVNGAIDGEPLVASSSSMRVRAPRWWRPVAGAAVAAGVAAVAVVALQQRAVAPGAHGPMRAAQNLAAPNTASPNAAASTVTVTSGTAPLAAARNAGRSGVPSASPKEAIAYTVPAVSTEAPTVMPAARLTNYIFAHSRYSSVLGQSNVLSGLLAGADEPTADPDRSAIGTPTDGTPAIGTPADVGARRASGKDAATAP